MAKGRVMGGGSPRRGMLPPTGEGPIEVTREYVEQMSGAGEASGTPVEKQPIPSQSEEEKPKEKTEPKKKTVLPKKKTVLPKKKTVLPEKKTSDESQPELPAEDAPLEEIVSAASKIIHDAVVHYESGQYELTEELFRRAGPAVRRVHATKAFKAIVDSSTGRPYRSFRKWVADEGISKSHAYRMVNEIPVIEALGSLCSERLPSGHIDVLAPILRQYDEETLRKLWRTAEAGARAVRSGGLPTKNHLLKARQVLGLSVQPDDTEPPASSDPAKTFRQVQKALHILASTDALRLAMQHDPRAVRELVEAVFGVTAETDSPLPQGESEGRG